MRKPDNGLRARLIEKIPSAHWTTIENAAGSRGTPDLNGCLSGREIWIECKFTSTRAVELRPEQCAWIRQRTRAGGRVLVVTHRKHDGGPRRGPPVDELWIHSGEVASELRERGLAETLSGLLLVERGGPRRWSWDRVREVLWHSAAEQHEGLPPEERSDG